MGTMTASEAVAEDVAFKFREEIDDLVAESAAQDALARLQDFVRDFAPGLKKDVLLLRARHSQWRTNQRAGIDTGERITAIRAAILDLADQTFEEAGGRRPIGLRLVVDNAPQPVVVAPAPVAPAPAAPAAAPEQTEAAPVTPPAAPVVSIAPLLSAADVERTASQGGLDNLRRHYFKTLRKDDELLACSSKNITRKYARGGFSLNPISLDLRAGEITGIVGRNASGKTTLLKLLMGEIKPDAGELTFPSLTRTGKGWNHIKNQIGYVSQLPDKWQGRLRHNLNFVAAANAQKGQDVSEIVDWNVSRYDLERYADATWDEISGGYKIRFELVRALVSQPKLLFLDEPLAYLDVVARQRFLKDLETIATSIQAPIPIVITSQHLSEIEAIADQMVLLDDGVCKFAGPIEGIGEMLPDCMVEISLRTDRTNLEAALSGTNLRRMERTMEGFILAFPKGVNQGEIFQRLHAAFGGEFTAFRDISNSARALMSEDLR